MIPPPHCRAEASSRLVGGGLVVASSLWDDSGVSVDLAGLVAFAPHLVILHLPVTLDESALQEGGFQDRRAEHRGAREEWDGQWKGRQKSARAHSLPVVGERRGKGGGKWKRKEGEKYD
jgi:hypothetical protein